MNELYGSVLAFRTNRLLCVTCKNYMLDLVNVSSMGLKL